MKTLPWIDPVIVQKKAEPFDDPDWVYELKYDGFRGVLYYEEGECCLFSKQSKRLPFKKLEDDLAQLLGKLKIKSLILDGEVVCMSEEGRPLFWKLMKRESPPIYVAFDILWLNGKDLRSIPLHERKVVLTKTLKEKIKTSFFIVGRGVDLYDLTLKNDLEGIVAKRSEGLYSKKARWYKVKNKNYSQEKDRQRAFSRKTKARAKK